MTAMSRASKSAPAARAMPCRRVRTMCPASSGANIRTGPGWSVSKRRRQVPLQVGAQARVVVEEAEQDRRLAFAGGRQHPALAVVEVATGRGCARPRSSAPRAPRPRAAAKAVACAMRHARRSADEGSGAAQAAHGACHYPGRRSRALVAKRVVTGARSGLRASGGKGIAKKIARAVIFTFLVA